MRVLPVCTLIRDIYGKYNNSTTSPQILAVTQTILLTYVTVTDQLKNKSIILMKIYIIVLK